LSAVNVNLRMNEAVPARRELKLRDGTMSFLEWKGAGPQPTLHFAHANGFNAMTYRHLLGPLATRFHIRASDARGHGMSQWPADPATHHNWYVYRDDLISHLEIFAAEAGGPVLLAGHSMGATASLLAAAERPDLVRGIVLFEPVIVAARHRRMMRLMRMFGRSFGPLALAESAARRRSVYPDRAAVVAAYTGRGAFRTWPQEMLVDYVEGGTKPRDDGQVELACNPLWEAANFRAHDHDTWAAIARLKSPLTLVYGGKDSTCRAPAPTLLGERDPQAIILRVGQSSHFLPMEFPDITRREILALDARLS
jgi:pimeloyl-ACP methyl ester carboxylesterase